MKPGRVFIHLFSEQSFTLYIIHLDLFYKILLKNEEFILFWKLYMVILLNTEIHATNS